MSHDEPELSAPADTIGSMGHILSSDAENGRPSARSTPVSALLAAWFQRGAEGKTTTGIEVDTDHAASSVIVDAELTPAELLQAVQSQDFPVVLIDPPAPRRRS